MVMNIEKKNVGLTTERLLPYTQLNAEVNESVSTAINQLFVLLERKQSEVHTAHVCNRRNEEGVGE